MKQLLHQWFEQSVPFEGIQACAILQADQSTSSKSWAEGFEELALDYAMHQVAEVFQALEAQRLPTRRLQWSFGRAFLHCERRHDGTCLAVVTKPDPSSFDARDLDRMFAEFQAISATSSL